MPDTAHILRIKRTDSDSYLLLHITQAATSRPLDLKLVATDHESLFHGSVKGSQVETLRSDHFSGDVDELRDIFCTVLLHTQPEGRSIDAYSGLELVAAIKKDAATITVRKNVEGITQRVASIKLIEDTDREEVSAFEWVDSAVAVSDELRAELQSSHSTLTAQETENARQKQLLEEMVDMKKQMEEDMLQKFVVLLNTKKQRIRELTRLLNRHSIDINAAISEEQDSASGGKAGSKRKAEPEDDSDHDMEDPQDDDAVETPQDTADDATDDEMEDVHSAGKSGRAYTQEEAAKERTLTMADLPPRRVLDFGKKQKEGPNHQNGAAVAQDGGHDDDEETDDEL